MLKQVVKHAVAIGVAFYYVTMQAINCTWVRVY